VFAIGPAGIVSTGEDFNSSAALPKFLPNKRTMKQEVHLLNLGHAEVVSFQTIE
jgi:hypothetical protein|tara:strand:+ start:503 stop:664 length:162 start_codon:yes stop_codon:yes gene_type:complete